LRIDDAFFYLCQHLYCNCMLCYRVHRLFPKLFFLELSFKSCIYFGSNLRYWLSLSFTRKVSVQSSRRLRLVSQTECASHTTVSRKKRDRLYGSRIQRFVKLWGNDLVVSKHGLTWIVYFFSGHVEFVPHFVAPFPQSFKCYGCYQYRTLGYRPAPLTCSAPCIG
jgi:hypothetical protein